MAGWPDSRALQAASRVLQWTWGLPQNLAGAVLALEHRACRRERFRSAIVTYWQHSSGVSLGMFVFVPARAGAGESRRLVVHEYGHTLQSLLLGPAYLLVVGLPSAVWANSERARARRAATGRSYYDYWCEAWANRWGGRVTGKPHPR